MPQIETIFSPIRTSSRLSDELKFQGKSRFHFDRERGTIFIEE